MHFYLAYGLHDYVLFMFKFLFSEWRIYHSEPHEHSRSTKSAYDDSGWTMSYVSGKGKRREQENRKADEKKTKTTTTTAHINRPAWEGDIILMAPVVGGIFFYWIIRSWGGTIPAEEVMLRWTCLMRVLRRTVWIPPYWEDLLDLYSQTRGGLHTEKAPVSM